MTLLSHQARHVMCLVITVGCIVGVILGQTATALRPATAPTTASAPASGPSTKPTSRPSGEDNKGADREIIQKLDAKVLTIAVTGMEARDLVKMAGMVADVPARVDWDAIGADASAPVTIQVKDASLQSVMEDILKQLGVQGKTTWAITQDGNVTWTLKR